MKLRAEEIKRIVFKATYEISGTYTTKTNWEQVARKVNKLSKKKRTYED